MALTKIDDRGLKTPIDLLDSEKIRFGTGNDSSIWHDGSHAYLQNTTGNLYIQPKASENAIKLVPDGAVELYYDNELRISTGNYGTTFKGKEGFQCEIHIQGDEGDDNADKWQLHVGDAGFRILDYTSGSWEDNIECHGNGGVDLYYDNSKKLETASYGAAVTGYLQVGIGGGTNGLLANDNIKLRLGTDQDLQIFHNGTQSLIDNSTGDLFIRNFGGDIRLQAKATEESVWCHDDGAVELYYDGSKKFQTGSGGISVTGKIHTQLGTETNSFNRETTGDQVTFSTTGTVRGSISSNGSTVAFNTSSSDRTLKKNFQDWTDSVLPDFKALKPQTFNFTFEEDDDAKHKGYIAQDNVAAFPEAYPKNDNDKYFFNPSGMTVYLMKALQEAIIKIETLETEVAALKAK